MLTARDMVRQSNRDWLADRLASLPHHMARAVAAEHRRRLKGRDADSVSHTVLRPVNLWLLDLLKRLPERALSLASSDEDIREQATKWAADVEKLREQGAEPFERDAFCVSKGCTKPKGKREAAKWARAADPTWWRRQLRSSHARAVESVSIETGLVHKFAGLYASHDAMTRRTQQRARNRALLESVSAVNELGQTYTLDQLAAVSVSNPAIRRAELMTRIAGFELIAVGLGHAGEFYTLTTPSQFHARHHNGRPNKRYDPKNTPLEAQRYLCRVWAQIRADLHRRGIKLYGFRVVEPHHDGTPHWHMLMFLPPQHVDTVREVMRKHALKLDGNEPGATERRFTVKAIDWSRGSAAGYIAKYIAKNIDGVGATGASIGEDFEGRHGTSAAEGAARVDGWASTWGIRQFQQIGGAPVTIWRELRRVDVPGGGDVLEQAATAADDGNWSEFVRLMGGPLVSRCDLPLSLAKEAAEQPNRYGETGVPVVHGVVAVESGEYLKTRIHEWVVQRSGAAAQPWSAVNNCTEPTFDAAINRGDPLTEFEQQDDPIVSGLLLTQIEQAGGIDAYLSPYRSAAQIQRDGALSVVKGRRMLAHWKHAGLAGIGRQRDGTIAAGAGRSSRRQHDQRQRQGAGVRQGSDGNDWGAGDRVDRHDQGIADLATAMRGAQSWLRNPSLGM